MTILFGFSIPKTLQNQSHRLSKLKIFGFKILDFYEVI